MVLSSSLPVNTLLEWLGQEVIKVTGSTNLSVQQIHGYRLSNVESLTFLGQKQTLIQTKKVLAKVVVADFSWENCFSNSPSNVWIEVKNSYESMVWVLNKINPYLTNHNGMSKITQSNPPSLEIHPSAEVHPTAVIEGQVGEYTHIGPGCYVGKNSVISRGCILEPNVTILDRCILKQNTKVQSGVVIGSAGFGFYSKENRLVSTPHLGGVLIGQNCWIGANSVIAAGVWDPTTIGGNCCLDSHVQIAHNVILGEGAALASQSGIAGSTTIGKGLRLGGNASIDGHLELGDHVSVAALSGVTKNIASHQTVAGFPARDIKKWRKEQISLRQSQN